jgi:hypothetical protein
MEHDLEKVKILKLILSAFKQLLGLKIDFYSIKEGDYLKKKKIDNLSIQETMKQDFAYHEHRTRTGRRISLELDVS